MSVKKFVRLLFLGLSLLGCDINEFKFENIKVQPIKGTYGVALGSITYTMERLIIEANISDEYLKKDSLDFYFLSYTDNFFSYTKKNEFVQINDISNNGVLKNPLPPTGIIINPIETRSISGNFRFSYDAQDGEELDSLFHNGGQITATFTSNAMVSEVVFRLAFENTVNVNTRRPIVLSERIVGMPAMAGQTVTIQDTEPLNDHVTLLPNATNEFDVSFGAIFTLVAGQQLDGTESVSFDFIFGNQTFSLVYGKFGQNTVQLNSGSSISFNFFDNLDEGIFFKEPTIRINAENAFGIPIALDFSGVYGDDGNGGNQTFLDGIITNPRYLPEVPAAESTETAVKETFEINSTNSNLREVFANSPSRLVFDIDGKSNHYDVNNQKSNFLATNSFITCEYEINLPIEVKLENFQDTTNFLIETGLQTGDLDSAFLRVVTINEVPFSGTLIIDVKDQNGEVVYSTEEEVVMTPPFINVNGEVTDPNGNSVDIPISKNGLNALINKGSVDLILTLNTSKSQTANEIFVKVNANDKIEIKVGLGGIINIDLD